MDINMDPFINNGNTNNSRDDVIGKASITKNQPNTDSKFSFWIKDDVIINPFDFVTAEQVRNTKTIGLVETISAITDSESHLTNYVSNDFGKVDVEPNTNRISTNIAECIVMHNTGVYDDNFGIQRSIMMPVPNENQIRFSSISEISEALGINQIKVEDRIPAGVILQSNGISLPLYLDKRFILGPEGAHINISGISGLATKTSYAMFIIQAILQNTTGNKPAVIIFNVKKDDLLGIDEPPAEDEIKELDKKLYDILKIQSTPFQNVTYFLPRGRSGGPNSFKKPHNYQIYAFALQDSIEELDLLLSEVNDPEGTIESIIYRIIEKKDDVLKDCINWEDLYGNKLDEIIKDKTIHPKSIGKFRRHVKRITGGGGSGIFVRKRNNEVHLVEKIKYIKSGEVFVIDIANLKNEEEKGFVIGNVMKTINNLYLDENVDDDENMKDSTPKSFIIFMDELNKFAPKSSKLSSVAREIVEVSARGRSSGLILIGAEQFKSTINVEVNENSSTHVMGRTGSMELSSEAYKFLSPALKNNLLMLNKGELLISHPIFRQAVKIIFPRPFYKTPRT